MKMFHGKESIDAHVCVDFYSNIETQVFGDTSENIGDVSCPRFLCAYFSFPMRISCLFTQIVLLLQSQQIHTTQTKNNYMKQIPQEQYKIQDVRFTFLFSENRQFTELFQGQEKHKYPHKDMGIYCIRETRYHYDASENVDKK